MEMNKDKLLTILDLALRFNGQLFKYKGKEYFHVTLRMVLPCEDMAISIKEFIGLESAIITKAKESYVLQINRKTDCEKIWEFLIKNKLCDPQNNKFVVWSTMFQLSKFSKHITQEQKDMFINMKQKLNSV